SASRHPVMPRDRDPGPEFSHPNQFNPDSAPVSRRGGAAGIDWTTDRPAMILDRGPDPPPRSAMSRVGVLALLLLAGVLTATALAAGDTQPQPPDRGGKDPRPPVV